MLSITLAEKLLATMSDDLISRQATSFASGWLKLSDNDFLPWLYWLKYPDPFKLPGLLSSGHGGSIRVTHGRVLVSIRITSAPRCASCRVQYGPAHTQLKSATRIPSSGNFAILDHTLTGQLFDSRRCHPELSAENLRVVLPQRRRRHPNLPRRARILDWRARILMSARDRLSNVDKKIARLQMLRVQQVAHRRHRRKRHS